MLELGTHNNSTAIRQWSLIPRAHQERRFLTCLMIRYNAAYRNKHRPQKALRVTELLSAQLE
ncbi:hypothetical protein THTE_2079 [Thermogutta terrifontis]|uniref:Uncharacterized protein n=1 Tax=Thermogutta terrifontis TaxID=1331910 RepID=A0A286RFE1_9BACT|nr:hypothetical protein THTE_2079 [Thermogutta terrifontis]